MLGFHYTSGGWWVDSTRPMSLTTVPCILLALMVRAHFQLYSPSWYLGPVRTNMRIPVSLLSICALNSWFSCWFEGLSIPNWLFSLHSWSCSGQMPLMSLTSLSKPMCFNFKKISSQLNTCEHHHHLRTGNRIAYNGSLTSTRSLVLEILQSCGASS